MIFVIGRACLAFRGNSVVRQYLSLLRGFPAVCKAKKSKSNPGDGNSFSLETMSALQLIARAGSDFISVHRLSGAVEDCSLSHDDFRGLHSHDLLATGFMDRVHLTDRPGILRALSAAWHERENVRVELRLQSGSPKRAPAPYCWIELTCSPFLAKEVDGSQDELVLVIARDISAWKEREEDLLAQQQKALELIATKTRILSHISHELRTPLNAIIGFSQMISQPGISAANERQMVEYAGIINDSGKHLLGVVDEAFDLSQLEAGQYEPSAQIFCIADLVTTCMELVQFEAEKKTVRLVVEGLADAVRSSARMSADQKICKQVIVGVLAALIKASPRGETVSLSIDTGNGSAASGYAEFTATGSIADQALDVPMFCAGSQILEYVDLLDGQIHTSVNEAGQYETCLQLPSGAASGSDLSNVVLIETPIKVHDKGPVRLKKSV